MADAATAAAAAGALYWTKVAAIGQVAAALATTCAVIVSLWIALSGRSIKLRVTAGLRVIPPGYVSSAADVVAIEIVNRGQRIVHVEAVAWRTGWLRMRWLKILGHEYVSINAYLAPGSDTTPFSAEPGEKKTISIRASDMRLTPAHRELFTRRLPWWPAPGPANICAAVFVATGKTKIAKVEKSLAGFLVTGEIRLGAARLNERDTAGGI